MRGQRVEMSHLLIDPVRQDKQVRGRVNPTELGQFRGICLGACPHALQGGLGRVVVAPQPTADAGFLHQRD